MYRRMSCGGGGEQCVTSGVGAVARRPETPAFMRLSPVPSPAQHLGSRALRTLTTLNTLDTNTCTSTTRGLLPLFGIWMGSGTSWGELRLEKDGQSEGWRSRSPCALGPKSQSSRPYALYLPNAGALKPCC